MDRKMFWGSFFTIVSLSILGLILSGIFWSPEPAGVAMMAIVGTLLISTIVWLPLVYFIKKYQENRRSKA